MAKLVTALLEVTGNAKTGAKLELGTQATQPFPETRYSLFCDEEDEDGWRCKHVARIG